MKRFLFACLATLLVLRAPLAWAQPGADASVAEASAADAALAAPMDASAAEPDAGDAGDAAPEDAAASPAPDASAATEPPSPAAAQGAADASTSDASASASDAAAPEAGSAGASVGAFLSGAIAAPQAERSETGGGFRFRLGDFVLRLLPYLQGEYQWNQQSENELSSDGTRLLNLDRFLLRRGRFVVGVEHRWMAALLELDASTTNGPAFSVRQAEATLRFPVPLEQPAPAMVTLGMFRTPFGYEVLRSARDREFMENSTVMSAFFPGESDLGVRVQGQVSWLRYALALVNGVPIDSPRYAAQAPVAPRDLVGRVGVDTRGEGWRLAAGFSAAGGSGFHPGSPQGQDALGVRDANESGTLQADSLVLLQGRSQVASSSFARFAAGLDASLYVRPVRPLWLHAYAEGVFGQNMDRALFVSDPVVTGFDVRALGLVGALTASLYDIGLLGVRVDWYNPNVDGRIVRGGRTLVSSQDVLTASFLAGVQVPGTAARLVAQFDLVRDHLALGANGLPTDLANNRFTIRLQVSP